MTNPTPEGQQAPTEALIERLLELCRCGPDESCLYCETLPAAITTLTAENARLKSQTQDDCPEYAGSPVCKIHSYNEAHEIALGMGYPSITDAFEGQSAAIERLREVLGGVTDLLVATVTEFGGWGAETHPKVIAARAALKETGNAE